MSHSLYRFGVAFACVVVALAEPSVVHYPADATLRDAVMNESAIYLSAYDFNEVWKVDATNGAIISRVAVGKGASALAFDGETLACVNRSAKTVSLIRLSDFSIAGESAIGDGAGEITALPGGGFAVANSFSDSVTLIDPANSGATVTISGITSVPSGIAASESLLAVTTRSPAALLVYEGGSQRPKTSVPLPDGASKIAALPGNRFAVVTRHSVVLVDGNAGSIVAERAAAAHDIAVSGSRVYILGSGEVITCDASLNVLDTTTVDADARSIAIGTTGYALLSPKTRSWSLATGLPAGDFVGEPAPTAVAAVSEAAVEAPAPQATPEPVVIAKAAPVEEPVVSVTEPEPVMAEKSPDLEASPEPETPAAVVSPEPEPEPEVTAPVAAASPEPEPEVNTTPEPSPEMEGATEGEAGTVAERDKKQSKADRKKARRPKSAQSAPWPVRKSRIRPGGEVPQPDMTPGARTRSQRPDVSPLGSGAVTETTIGETVTEGITEGLTAEGGFTPPTSADEFLDVTADEMTQNPDGSLVANGDVRFRLMGAPDVEFAADHVEYESKTGRLFVSGNVEIVQGPSTAFADEITTIIYPGSTKLRTPPPLTGPDDSDDDLTRKLLSIGSLDAKNIDIIEPTRRLRAQQVIYDFQTHSGVMYDLEGQAGQIRFGGEELQVEGEDKGSGKDLWLTTCDCDHEYYRIRVRELQLEGGGAMLGKGAQLEIGNTKTPIYWPRWGYQGGPTPTAGFDFDSGRKAELGYYVNVGQQFAVTPELRLGLRLFPTTKEGIGIGFDGSYDYMETPASPMFRSSGEFHTLYTTKDRGYYEWYHRHEITPNTVLLGNIEQWGDRDFYKDFYYEQYKDRTQPRTFVNVTHTKPGYTATATVRKSTNGFVSETERLPELSFHLLERELLPRVYLTFDTVNGYNDREPEGDEALRSVNVARLSTDIELGDALNVTPFLEFEASYYSKTRDKGESDARISALTGATLQTRFQKAYGGAWGFASFKHIVVPSLTYSYRNEPTMGVEESPRFDAYDNVYGRSRIESKIDNIVMGKDAETGQTWQVARVSLYHGSDLWNEIRESTDYEIEIDLRPRSWWGLQTIGEHHSTEDEGDIELDDPFILQRGLIELYERVLDKPFDPETADKYNTRYGDYDRFLTFFYYDNRDFGGNINGRIGFAYTKTQEEVFNREILYGLGYQINDKWSVAFEHRYDLERGELYRQKYEVRRVMNCLEGALLINERESGWDFGVELSVTGIPGTRIRF